MDVTSQNFELVNEEFSKLVPTCEFYSFDEEMTGINFPGRRDNIGDTPAQTYPNKKEVAETFSIIQFGVCLFHKCENGNGYIARPFNFYLFPETDHDLNMSASAINFNKKHNMDFQRWIYNGISYVNTEKESELQQKRLDALAKNDQNKNKVFTLNNDRDKSWYENASKRFKTWSEDEEMSDAFNIQASNVVQRLYFEQEAKKIDSNLGFHCRNSGSGGGYKRTYVAIKRSEQEKIREEKQNEERQLKQFKKRLGFFNTFQTLVDSKKPIVGHNLLYDILFMLNSFHLPLPEEYKEFKNRVHELFPVVYDTKLIAKSFGTRFESTALEPLYNTVIEEGSREETQLVNVKLPLGFMDYAPEVLKNHTNKADSRAHEAGFDAYMTGYIYLQLKTQMEEKIFDFKNKINLMFTFFEINLEGEDTDITEGPVIYVSDFDPQLKTHNLLNMMGEFEGKVYWVSDTSCYFVMADNVEENQIMELLNKNVNIKAQPRIKVE